MLKGGWASPSGTDGPEVASLPAPFLTPSLPSPGPSCPLPLFVLPPVPRSPSSPPSVPASVPSTPPPHSSTRSPHPSPSSPPAPGGPASASRSSSAASKSSEPLASPCAVWHGSMRNGVWHTGLQHEIKRGPFIGSGKERLWEKSCECGTTKPSSLTPGIENVPMEPLDSAAMGEGQEGPEGAGSRDLTTQM